MQPNDQGPIYTETILGRFPVEPWNTYSNLIFLFSFLYFAWKTKLDWKKYPLLTIALPILLIGFVGGTVYHATRSDRIWLMMDYIPIFLLCLLATYYFWRRLTGNVFLGILGVVLPFGIIRLLWLFPTLSLMPRIAFGYSLLACSLLLPAVLCSYKEGWLAARLLILAGSSFLIAIVCRSIDTTWGASLPMGTHFLWHLFGGLASFFMLSFIAVMEASRAIEKKLQKES